jgi:hypothetical protein
MKGVRAFVASMLALCIVSILFYDRTSTIPSFSTDVTTNRAHPPPNVAMTGIKGWDCATDECVRHWTMPLARVHRDASQDKGWCTPHSKGKKDRYKGQFLVRVPKAASSTAGGVARRIAHRHNSSVVAEHLYEMEGRHMKRNYGQSFLWTIVREPDSRALSRIFWGFVTFRQHENKTTNDDDIIQALSTNTHLQYGTTTDGEGGFQVRYIAFDRVPKYSFWNPEEPDHVQNLPKLQAYIREAMEGYDFIVVQDRMDESLVALSFRVGVGVEDVLVSSTKLAGSYFRRYRHHGPRIPTVPVHRSPAIDQHFASPSWRVRNFGDYMLHHAASLSLDRTIEDIGKEPFENALSEYRRLQGLVKQHCSTPETAIVEPDVLNECYRSDEGCGYHCMDEVLSLLLECRH